MKLGSLESLHWEQFESLVHGNSLFMMLNIITFFRLATFKKEKDININSGQSYVNSQGIRIMLSDSCYLCVFLIVEIF